MDPVVFLQQIVNGLSIGLVYALMAIGFTLIFGVLNVVNFAHGEIYTLGAFVGLLLITLLQPPLWLVLVLRRFLLLALRRLPPVLVLWVPLLLRSLLVVTYYDR